HAVELVGKTGGCHHSLTPAIGATNEVAVIGFAAIVAIEDALGRAGDLTHGVVAVVDTRLRIHAEEGASHHRSGLGGVAAVGAKHGIAHAESIGGLAGAGQAAEGRADGAVGATATLEEEATVPFCRQTPFEANGIRFAVNWTDTFVEVAKNAAVGRCL